MNLQGLYGAVPLAHFFLRERLKPGDRAIDATCGNGHDTILLAELAGSSGKVWAFDIQQQALEKTRERLAAAGLSCRVEFIEASHQFMEDYVDEQAAAIVFNLGYLPSGGKEIKTSAETTVAALAQGQRLLRPAGIILIAVYTGHEGGKEEWSAVKSWAENLPADEFNVWQSRQLNRSDKAPLLVMVEKTESSAELDQKSACQNKDS